MKTVQNGNGRRLRTGVVGLGRIGWDFHCSQLSSSLHYSLTAACDTSQERRNEAEAKFGLNGYATVEQMLSEERLDVVIVALPTHLHLPVARAALAAGCHVVVEKPAALNYAETAELFRCAAEAKLIATVYQPMRCMRAQRKLAEAVQAGDFGRIFVARRFGHSFTRRNDWQSLSRFGGGSIMNAGAHLIDQLVDIWGRDLRLVRAVTRKIHALGDAEDYFHATIETPDGASLEVEVNPSCFDPSMVPAFAVYGDRGNYVQRDDNHAFLFLNESELPPRALDDQLLATGRKYLGETPPVTVDSFTESPWRQDNPLFYENVYDAITHGSPLLTPPGDTLAVMNLIEQIKGHPCDHRESLSTAMLCPT